MSKIKWPVEYGNDTGHNDESFWEWWNVTNGAIVFRANSEEEAHRLCDLLNERGLP
jgi:hypothetical protein